MTDQLQRIQIFIIAIYVICGSNIEHLCDTLIVRSDSDYRTSPSNEAGADQSASCGVVILPIVIRNTLIKKKIVL